MSGSKGIARSAELGPSSPASPIVTDLGPAPFARPGPEPLADARRQGSSPPDRPNALDRERALGLLEELVETEDRLESLQPVEGAG
jgi:hypothetical protein